MKKTKKKKINWVRIGQISVDSGLCWVGDPCYVVAKDSSHVFDSWAKFCDELDLTHSPFAAHCFPGTGVCVSAGYGDGSYPVYAEYKGGVIQQVKVDFR